jgi:hypothetical protein
MRALSMLYLSLTVALAACGPSSSSHTADAAPPPPPPDASPPPDAGVPPDAPMASHGRSTTGAVSGGVKAKSPHYKLIGTMSRGGGPAASPSYQVRSGVTGAMQP